MAIKFRCPSCGTQDVADGTMSGKAVACASCGKSIRLPSSAEGSNGTIEFRCDGCGKAMAAPAHLTGKKVTCKACGRQGVKIPGAPAETTTARPSATTKTHARPATVVESRPSPLDIFGLDESAPASVAKSPADDLFADATAARRPAVAAEEALPSRNKVFEPMSAAKKKKISKRADKINKEKPSFAGAGMGVSFGTILAITLFGWRLYRIGNKVTRGLDPGVHDAAPFEPAGLEGPVNLDPKALAAEGDREIERMLKEPGSAEAREWLDPAKFPNHGVFEMGNERARAMIAGFYERGAKRVSVLEPEPIGNNIMTASIAVELPEAPEKRAQCLAWETQFLEGEEPTQDLGQKYLMITTD